MKESALLERKAKGDMKRALTPMRKSVPVTPMPESEGLGASALGSDPAVSAASGTVHVVKPGETIYRISRRYGITVDKVRKWNKLSDDIIEVGQRLIVGQE
jgi:hypothetical protein